MVQEADRRQPPSNVDLAPPARGALLETFRVAAHAIQTVHAPVTLLVADRVAQAVAGPVTSVAAAQRVATYLAAVAEPAAQRAAAAHVVVEPVAVVVAVEDKYVI